MATNDDVLTMQEAMEKHISPALQKLQLQSATLSRAMLSGRLGTQFQGDRDLYQTFGYITNPQYQDYKDLYDRQGLAGRAVRKFADDTWNKAPVLVDGDAKSDNPEGITPFLKSWVALSKRLKVWNMFRQADIMCGFSRYSLIFIGTPANSFADPMTKAGKDAVFFLQAFSEGTASIESYIEDIRSPMFAMPKYYNVQFAGEEGEIVNIPGGSKIHYSRVIHIAEEKLGSRVFGTPRLKSVINRLFDLEKTTGGGAEAAWLAVFKGMLFLAQEGAQLPAAGTPEATALDETINKFMHRIQRYAALEGVDVKDLGVSEVNVKNIFEVLIDDFCGSLGIPKRILLGSERGELASSQDKIEWNGVIDSRRTNHAEPEIARPFIDSMIRNGVIPAPTSGEYNLEWAPVYPMTKTETATYSLTVAQGASAVTGGNPEEALDINEWRVMNDLPARSDAELKALQEEADKQAEAGQGIPPGAAGAKDEEGAGGNGKDAAANPLDELEVAKNSKINFTMRDLFPNSFPDHKGRPGKRGGSLPRGESAESVSEDKEAGGNAPREFQEERSGVTDLWGEGQFDESQLSEGELKALKEYKGSSLALNNWLRDGEQGYSPLKDSRRDNLDSAISKATLKESVITFRGINRNALGEQLDDYTGLEFTDKAFVSTTLHEQSAIKWSLDNADVAGGTVIKFQLPKGSNAIYMDDTGIYDRDEYELLLPRNKTYRVVKDEQKDYFKDGKKLSRLLTVEVIGD